MGGRAQPENILLNFSSVSKRFVSIAICHKNWSLHRHAYSLVSYSYLKRHKSLTLTLTLTLKPRLNPQTAL